MKKAISKEEIQHSDGRSPRSGGGRDGDMYSRDHYKGYPPPDYRMPGGEWVEAEAL